MAYREIPDDGKPIPRYCENLTAEIKTAVGDKPRAKVRASTPGVCRPT